MTTSYCSPDCQKRHWASHKALCQHTASQTAKASALASAGGHGDEIAKNLRKFTSAHNVLLGWSAFQALQLKRVPANMRAHALLLELAPRAHPDAAGRFAIAARHVVPRAYVQDPLVAADIARREERCRANGGAGCLVVILQCAGISQVVPVEIDPPAKISWDERADWATVLEHYVSQARVDFKPISTTSRGVRYG